MKFLISVKCCLVLLVDKIKNEEIRIELEIE